tara:strand:+ start:419 stop:1963 length:1545 start_codon:yes stop_codon:yes gene_type:complete
MLILINLSDNCNSNLILSGCGGTGRRAALRSLWEKSCGSSSLLGRTNLKRIIMEIKSNQKLEKKDSFEDKSDPNKLLKLITKLINEKENTKIIDLIEEIHPADLAELIEKLDEDRRHSLLLVIKKDFNLETLTYLDDNIRDEIIDFLGIETLAPNVTDLDVDDAVDVVEDLEKSDQETLLKSLPTNERQLIQEGLNYPEDSAGRLMQRNYIAFPNNWNVGQAIDSLRSNKKLPEDFYDIYLYKEDKTIDSIVPLGRIMASKRNQMLSEIKNKNERFVKALTDQEEVAYMFNKYGLVSAPVIDENKKIIGSITVDDVVNVIEEEREEDILKLGGVAQTDLYSAVINTTKSRFSWLFVNLLTAIIASIVIGFFQASIEKVVALAILMPIVASMGGNAGTQTLTVSVRALATKELTASNALKIIGKETFVGGINGLIFAVFIGTISGFWFNDYMLGLVIGLAMVINLILAGFAGIFIPLTLNKLKIDPALASVVVLTTLTDVFGFLSFLGLASLLLF